MIANFFSVIHEFAVLGTTFFMMALVTLWYSPILFGNMWNRVTGSKVQVFDEESPQFVKQLGVIFISYLGLVALLAWLVAYTAMISLSPWGLALGLAIFVVLITAAPVVFEGKSWRYYVIHTGFMVTFIFVSIGALVYWPW